MRLRLAGEKFPIPDPPNGTLWAVQAIVSNDSAALLDSALAYIQSVMVGDTWVGCADEGGLPVNKNVTAVWDAWMEAHPELTWEGRRVKAN